MEYLLTHGCSLHDLDNFSNVKADAFLQAVRSNDQEFDAAINNMIEGLRPKKDDTDNIETFVTRCLIFPENLEEIIKAAGEEAGDAPDLE